MCKPVSTRKGSQMAWNQRFRSLKRWFLKAVSHHQVVGIGKPNHNYGDRDPRLVGRDLAFQKTKSAPCVRSMEYLHGRYPIAQASRSFLFFSKKINWRSNNSLRRDISYGDTSLANYSHLHFIFFRGTKKVNKKASCSPTLRAHNPSFLFIFSIRNLPPKKTPSQIFRKICRGEVIKHRLYRNQTMSFKNIKIVKKLQTKNRKDDSNE